MANVQGLRDYVGACLYHSAYKGGKTKCDKLSYST